MVLRNVGGVTARGWPVCMRVAHAQSCAELRAGLSLALWLELTCLGPGLGLTSLSLLLGRLRSIPLGVGMILDCFNLFWYGATSTMKYEDL